LRLTVSPKLPIFYAPEAVVVLNFEPLYYIIQSGHERSMRSESMKRRHFLQLAAGTAANAVLSSSSALAYPTDTLALHIDTVSVELARNIVVQTAAYNQQVPGPILNMREGRTTRVVLTNRTADSRRMEWYGLPVSDAQASQRRIAPGATQIFDITPSASGTRWYRSSILPSAGNPNPSEDEPFGFLSILPRSITVTYDQEIFLAIRRWKTFTAEGKSLSLASFNDKLLHASEPIRVRSGQRILFRLLNASTQHETHLHLPGHRFEVIALDGNPVPRRASVEVLSLGPGERIDAIVAMNAPGRWILGSTSNHERMAGLGIHIEYANRSDEPRWSAPISDWSYAHFAVTDHPSRQVPANIFLEKNLAQPNSIQWISKGRSYSGLEDLLAAQSGDERLRIMNATSQAQTVHLSHSDFSLARVHHTPIAGLRKDTIRLSAYDVIDVDVVPHSQQDS
jgi:FtsP/CotA-like multicopper oxidase with cupredoxin domain